MESKYMHVVVVSLVAMLISRRRWDNDLEIDLGARKLQSEPIPITRATVLQ